MTTITINGVETQVPEGAIAYKYGDPTEGARWVYEQSDLDAIRGEDPSLIVETGHFHCECGEWSGERCAWSGSIDETVVVEYMPEHLRASHTAAGNRGIYPANGAQHIRVEQSCADLMVETDGDWCRIIT